MNHLKNNLQHIQVASTTCCYDVVTVLNNNNNNNKFFVCLSWQNFHTFQQMDVIYSGGDSLFGFHHGSVLRKSQTESGRSSSDWWGVF